MRFLLLVSILLASAPLLAQNNNRASRDLQFRFGNPGARSLGFGGAFIALADDATAPVANPAGMTRTSDRSISFELNYNRQKNRIPFQGGQILQTNLFEFDFNLQESSAPEDIFQIPYLAMVFSKNNFRYGFFLQQQANLQREYTTDPINICPFADNFYPNCQDGDNPITYPLSTDIMDIKMLNAGFSMAWLLGSRVSLGVSGFYSDMSYQSDSIIELPQTLDVVTVTRTARGDDQDFGYIGGLIWQATDSLSVGVTYKSQPEFEYLASLVKTRDVALFPPDFSQEAIFKIPDSVGFGVSIIPIDNLTINMDANRVYYSQVTDDFVDFTIAPNDIIITQTMEDITEIHAGFEWIFTQMATPISLRFGYWLNPYHAAVNNVDDNQILEGPIDKPFVRDIFFLQRFEEDDNHFSIGLGWTLARKLQLDFAIETADSGTNATISGIYRL